MSMSGLSVKARGVAVLKALAKRYVPSRAAKKPTKK